MMKNAKKKIMAVVLTGIILLGGGIGVHAAYTGSDTWSGVTSSGSWLSLPKNAHQGSYEVTLSHVWDSVKSGTGSLTIELWDRDAVIDDYIGTYTIQNGQSKSFYISGSSLLDGTDGKAELYINVKNHYVPSDGTIQFNWYD